MTMEYFETHAHYDTPEYDADRDAILRSVSDAGVSHILNVSYETGSSARSVALAGQYPWIHAAVGIHPQYIQCFDESAKTLLRELVQHPSVVAVGECGLDYFAWKSGKKEADGISAQTDIIAERERQMEAFRWQMELAAQAGLPVVVHSRAAGPDTMQILREFPSASGVMHSFSYSVEMALECVKLGWNIGIGPVITRPGARKIREVAEKVPLERLLIETDCPYQVTESCRGQRGDSRMLAQTAAEIAGIKGISAEEVAETTTANAGKLFSTSPI